MNKIVETDDNDTRLDRWLLRTELVNSVVEAQKLIRGGKVLVNGEKVKINSRVFISDEIECPEITINKIKKEKYQANAQDKELLLKAVLYKDDNVIVINKPAGLAVQGGSGSFKNLDAMLDVLKFDNNSRPKLVHRLDKHTSGVFILARNNQTAKKLLSYFKEKRVKKTYLAWVIGTPTQKTGEINAPLLKKIGGNEKVIISPRGKEAITKYKVVKQEKGATLLELSPLTGRMHQIRVHLSSIGHPIIGDGKYGGKRVYIKEFGDNIHLHAKEISFPNPEDENKKINVKAEPPKW